MSIRQPTQKIAAFLASIATANILLLLVHSPLSTPFGLASVWFSGFVTAAVIVLRREFKIEAENRDSERWRLEWRRIE